MSQVYNLAQMLKEIEEDETVSSMRKDYWVSQDEIKDLLNARKKRRNKDARDKS